MDIASLGSDLGMVSVITLFLKVYLIAEKLYQRGGGVTK